MLNILIIEDEEIVADVVSGMLKKLEHCTEIALTGQEGIRKFSETSSEIDFVILDWMLPDTNGGDVHDDIRKIKPNIPVLIASGYAPDNEVNSRIQTSGGKTGFAMKPFNMDILKTKVDELRI